MWAVTKCRALRCRIEGVGWRSPWIIRVGPKCNHQGPSEREAEGNVAKEERQPNEGSRDWSDALEDGGRGHEPRNAGGHQKLEMMGKQSLPSEAPESTQPCRHLDFSPVKLISDF